MFTKINNSYFQNFEFTILCFVFSISLSYNFTIINKLKNYNFEENKLKYIKTKLNNIENTLNNIKTKCNNIEDEIDRIKLDHKFIIKKTETLNILIDKIKLENYNIYEELLIEEYFN
jgi:Tfp pilus assembly protein PilO